MVVKELQIWLSHCCSIVIFFKCPLEKVKSMPDDPNFLEVSSQGFSELQR